jgi:hypothetical protein
MTDKKSLARRGFIGGGLAALGAAAGWLFRRNKEESGTPRRSPDAGKHYQYDISRYETVDPELILYQPTTRFETGHERVKRIGTAPGGRILVAGDRAVRFFDSEGRPEGKIAFQRPPHCIHATAEGRVFVGFGKHFEVYDENRDKVLETERFAENSFLTAIATHEDTVYVADAGMREVLICNDKGAVVDRFGKKDENRDNPGFAVPSPYFDLSVAPDGRLRICNPGRLRVESYSLDGRFESTWGEAGMVIDRFSGCCNPVFFAMTPDGGFVTSEKGLARIKVYDAYGGFQGVVAGPECLVEDPTAKAPGGKKGAGFDVAVAEDGRVLVLDPFQKVVRSFAPLA